MNLGTMRGLVSQRLAEGSGPVFYPASEINAALNEANRFFCLLTLGLETTQTWNVTASTPTFRMISIFPDWIAPLRISTPSGAKVRPARIEDLQALDVNWKDSPGWPVRYSYTGCDFLALYQQPIISIPLNVTYARAPLPLVNDGDTPETPAEYHPRYVEYAVYRCRQAEGAQEFAKVLPLLDSFLDGAKHYAAYVRSRNLGSRYDKVPFELESFDRSALLKLRPDLPPNQKAIP